MIDDHAFRTPCSFGSGMFMFASSYHSSLRFSSPHCVSRLSMIGITEHRRGEDTRTLRWPWPSPRPGYYTRVWQPGIIIKCESANKLSSRPGRKYEIIDLTGAHINYVRSEVHNNKRGTLWTEYLDRPVAHTSAMRALCESRDQRDSLCRAFLISHSGWRCNKIPTALVTLAEEIYWGL